MINLKSQSLGGKIMAKVQRDRALAQYYLNPNKCLTCNKIIEVRPFEKVPATKKKKFCSRSCAAIYNNSFRAQENTLTVDSISFCEICNSEIKLQPKSHKYIIRKRCDNCRRTNLNITIDFLTKDELFKKRKNWQSARSAIRNRATAIYKRSDKPKKCIICDYKNTYQVIHKKSVSSFPGSALISEINDINNLAALCLNCHWDYDHGLLDLNDK